MKIAHADVVYLDAVDNILENGVKKEDRTGTGTLSLFGTRSEYDLSRAFPLLITKQLPFRIIAEELLWFLRGSTNLKDLLEKNVNIWTDDGYRDYLSKGGNLSKEEFVEWVKDNGYDLGAIYGAQWRSWEDNGDSIDQLNDVIQQIKNNADSRRLLVTAWNPAVLGSVALPPCHVMYQFYVANGVLDCQLYQRSCDNFLGKPFNIASYALLVEIIAKMTGLKAGRFIHVVGDDHIYLNHLDAIHEQRCREIDRPMPKLAILNVRDRIEDYTIEDFKLIGYDPYPTIKAPLSVGLKEDRA